MLRGAAFFLPLSRWLAVSTTLPVSAVVPSAIATILLSVSTVLPTIVTILLSFSTALPIIATIPSRCLCSSAIHLGGHGNGLCCARGRLGAAGDHVYRPLLTIFHPPLLTLFYLIGLVVSLLSTYFANVIIFIGLVVTDAETEMGSAPAEMDSAGS